MGAVLGRHDTHKRSFHGSKLEAKMVDAMQQRASHGTSLKSFDSIIMKFPKIDESFRKCKTIFEQFGEFCPFCQCFGESGLMAIL
jgi:calcium-binding protein CML